MEKEAYKQTYEAEENHWWFKGIRKIIFSILDKKIKRNDLKILDSGCGTGILLTKLKKYGEPSGVDISEEALKYCKERGLKKLYKSSVENLPFKENTFDLVTSIDVIYHKEVQSDIKALKEINRVLKKDGLALIQVAAYNFMLSNHDKFVHTQRRYTKKELEKKLREMGFKIEKITYINTFLFPIALIKRLTESKNTKSELKPLPKIINDLFINILYLESKIINIINLPFGLSIICLARKQ
ncbi:MAG: class I SAM-dependent methyltransferase [Candidatus Woesearchaeota archaeon]